MRKSIILIILIFIIPICYSINYNDCNSTVPSGTHYLTQNVTTTGNCFTFTSSDTILDCQWYAISGDGSGVDYGFYSDSYNNITIRNCIIESFGSTGDAAGIYLKNSDNYILENLILSSNYYGIYSRSSHYGQFSNITINLSSIHGIYLWGSDHSVLTYITSHDNSASGIYIQDANNNIFNQLQLYNNDNAMYDSYSYNNNYTNIYAYDNNYGFYFYSISNLYPFTNTLIKNSQIYNNTNYNVYFNPSLYLINSTTFQNSYLGNFSKIYATDWNNVLNTDFTDNTYLNGTVPTPACFDAGNTVCETSSSDSSSQTISGIFPFTKSLFITIIIIIGYLLS